MKPDPLADIETLLQDVAKEGGTIASLAVIFQIHQTVMMNFLAINPVPRDRLFDINDALYTYLKTSVAASLLEAMYGDAKSQNLGPTTTGYIAACMNAAMVKVMPAHDRFSNLLEAAIKDFTPAPGKAN